MEGGGLFTCVQKFELKGLACGTNSTPKLGSRFVEFGRNKFFCLNERDEDSPHLIEAWAPKYTNLSYWCGLSSRVVLVPSIVEDSLFQHNIYSSHVLPRVDSTLVETISNPVWQLHLETIKR